jgi:hypothetical protein
MPTDPWKEEEEEEYLPLAKSGLHGYVCLSKNVSNLMIRVKTIVRLLVVSRMYLMLESKN